MVVNSEIKISFNGKTAKFPTVFMDGLHFLGSHWQFSQININMMNCHAAFLVLEFKHSNNVIIKNSTFDNWTFTQVQYVVIKNCSSSNTITRSFSTSLNFNNSSGLMENITINNQNFTRIDEGLFMQNYSYINLTNSNFMNNIVSYGLITVWNLSTLHLSDTNMLQNQAINCAGAIYVFNSVVHITNTNFNDNKAVRFGGATFAIGKSSLWITYSTFRNNKIPFEDSNSIESMLKDGCRGAIFFGNASVLELRDVNFTGNAAGCGGAIYFLIHSKLFAQNVYFSQNTANFGSVIYGGISCNVSCKHCFLYRNIAASNKPYAHGAGISLSNDSIINISGFTCENHIGYFTSCIAASSKCYITVYNSTFNMNTGSVISLSNSSFVIVSSSFFNNSTPSKGGAINSYNSTLHISESGFYHNEALVGGGLCLEFSTATVSNGTFVKNSAVGGGAAFVMQNSSLVISHSFFSENSATPQAGTFKIENSESVYDLNSTLSYLGGSIFSGNSSLLIFGTIFESNVVPSFCGAICGSANSSITIEDSQFKNNSVQDKAVGKGGGLCITENSSAKLSNVYFVANKAPAGGAIYVWGFCDITIYNNTIEANTGSAIVFQNNIHSKIYNSSFYDNLASYKGGGAILSKAGCILYVTKSLFKANKAISSGGVFFGVGISSFFHNCPCSDNFAFKGGVLATTNSNVELFTSNFTNNSATEGGVFATDGNLLLDHCIISNNTAHGNGGVGYIEENSQMIITRSIFRFNSATHAGGVLWLKKAIANITNSVFVSNWAGIGGGVIDAQFSSLINISHITCFGNKNKGGEGGVLSARRKTKVWINNAKIQNNSAYLCGIILIDTASVLEISSSLVSQNSADYEAGAFFIFNNSLSVFINSSFRGNTGYHAGSIVIVDSTTYLENCNLSRNQGTVAGAITVASSDLKLSNTVFLENKAKVVKDINCETSETQFINTLYTYRCNFKHDDVIIRSAVSSFEQVSYQNHIIRAKPDKTILKIMETQFASSKSFYLFKIFLVFHLM